MKEMYVNLKRYEVSESYGGICPVNEPRTWIRNIVHDTVELGLADAESFTLTMFLPESMLATGLEALALEPRERTAHFKLGCQGVFRDDIMPDENFGRFTANCPASALKALGCEWVLVGHSEERRDLTSLLKMYSECTNTKFDESAAADVCDMVMNKQLLSALRRQMSVLFCVGESEDQKGSDDPELYEPRVKSVLRRQIELGLANAVEILDKNESAELRLSIAYEPIWAVGPGKIPATSDYVAFVSKFIKETCVELFNREFPVIYGGGLTAKVAATLVDVESVDGGFVGLTQFTKPYKFETKEMKNIILTYTEGVKAK